MTNEPQLTVISNVRDDRERLPRAVASVLAAWDGPGVEVLVVDDGSTDGTGAVADALAAADPRVRVVHRDRSDGAPGAPRNLGLARARGTFVAFCDSDDEYLPGTLRRLVDLAVEQDADVAAGGVARFNERTGRTTPLAATAYVAAPVEPLAPGSPLWLDTIAVAKVVRRELVEREDIRFPEGILYEDQPFTVALWSRARRVATLSDTVYLWYVNNVEGQESITARRHEIGNFHDRVAANRAIDGYLAGRPALEAAKLDKFVRHDLALYGKDVDVRDDDYRDAFLSCAREYLATVPPELRTALDQPFRLVVRELVDGTPEGAVAACLFAYRRHHLDRPLEQRDGRLWWPYRPAAGSGPEHDLDDLVRSEQRRGRSLVTVAADTVTATGAAVRLEGTVVDGAGALGDRPRGPRLRLALVDRDAGTRLSQAVVRVRRGRFSAVLALPRPAPGEEPPHACDVKAAPVEGGLGTRVRALLSRSGTARLSPVEAPPGLGEADASADPPTTPAPTAGPALEPYRTRNGNLSLRPAATGAGETDGTGVTPTA